MTLGQLAVAVNASPRWVLNALTRLGVPRHYDEALARRLSLARLLDHTLAMRLTDAFALAGRILAEAHPRGTWQQESADGTLRLTIAMPRFLTVYAARLALATTQYGERGRGRKAHRTSMVMERAIGYGIDPTLLDSALRRTPGERVALLSENMEAVRALRTRRA